MRQAAPMLLLLAAVGPFTVAQAQVQSAACLHDFTNDALVATADLLYLLAVFGRESAGSPATARADVNGDGIVGTDDLLGLLAAFGRSCEATAAPAPPATFAAAAEAFAAAAVNASDPFIPLVSIASSISFNGDISLITESPQSRMAFEEDFAATMAASLGDGATVSPEAVIVDEIREVIAEWEEQGRRRLQGAENPATYTYIEVVFHLLLPESLQSAGASLVTTLQETDQQIEIAVAGVTFSADTASMATPTVVPAVVDCEGSWVPSDDCSEPCGPNGVRTQSFVVFRAEQNGGSNCVDAETLPEPLSCNTHVQCPVECAGEWGQWGDCSLPCGNGTQTRNYVVLQEPQHGGADCPDRDTSQGQECNTQACPPPPPEPVDCLGSWSDYGECSHLCGPDGAQQRTFTISQVASNGGSACAQEAGDMESQTCNTEIQCPVDCEGEWSDFGACSEVCGPGTRTRTFEVTVPAQFGGSCPEEDTTESEDCDNLCPAGLEESDVAAGPITLPVSGAFELATLVKVPDGETSGRGSAMPVARSYNGNDWEGTMPDPVSFTCTEAPVTCSTTLPAGAVYQLRIYDGTSIISQDPKEIASRFLTQTTFGPTLDELDSLSASTAEETETAIEGWLLEQMEMEPSLHRVYLRRRLNAMTYNKPQTMMRPPCEEASSWVTFAFSKFDQGRLLDVSLNADGSYSYSVEGIVRTVVESTKDIREDIGWSCYKRGFRTPLDMPGTVPTAEVSVEACHQRCISTEGCAYFSLDEDNMECHLQASSASGLQGSGGPWRSGPTDCTVSTYLYPAAPGDVEGLENMGSSCWGQCGAHGACPNRCGANGFCCRYGRDIGGCVTTDPSASSHRCIPDPSMPMPPPPPAPRLQANASYVICFVNEYEGGDVSLLVPGVSYPGSDWKRNGCGRQGSEQIIIGNAPVNLPEPDPFITQQLDAIDMVPMPIPVRNSFSLRNVSEPCELPPNPTVFIYHGDRYYRHEPRVQLVDNTVDNPYIEDRMIYQKDRQFIPSLTPTFCPAAKKAFTNAEGCVRQNSCSQPVWTEGTVTLDDDLMRQLFEKGQKYVYTVTGFSLDGFSDDEISACSVRTRWKKTAGACDVDTPLDAATLTSLSAALQQLPVEIPVDAYIEGPNNANSIDACVEGSGRAVHGTVEEMQALCNTDPNCGWLHDYGCDSNNWRACGPTSDMVAGSAGCTMLKTGTDVQTVQTELVLDTPHITIIEPVQGECNTQLNDVSIIGAKVTLNGTCYEQVHPQNYDVYDMAYWVGRLNGANAFHPLTRPAVLGQTELSLLSEGICVGSQPHCWPTRWSAGNGVPLVRRMGVYGEDVDFSSLPTTVQKPWLAEMAGVEDISVDPGVSESCGSLGEVANDPVYGHKYGGRYVGAQKPTYWPGEMLWQNAVFHSEDQLRQRVAWALSQIYVVSEAGFGGSEETHAQYYDIFLRNAFGSFRNLIQEIAYSYPMSVMLTYINSKSAAVSGDFADENFARECIQLFTVGTEHLNSDGTQVLDDDGNPIATYGVKDVASFARAWTGFVSPGGLRTNKIGGADVLQIVARDRDASPKMDLYDGFIGDGYPACVDLPKRAFLRKGFSYQYRGDSTEHLEADDSGVIAVVTLDDSASSLFQALCDPVDDVCTFPSQVTLAQSLPCFGEECTWDRAPIVKVVDGSGTDGYYQAVEFPCSRFPFFNDGQFVKYGAPFINTMSCADPRSASAAPLCCGNEATDGTGTARCEYWRERVTYATAVHRCETQGGQDVCQGNAAMANWNTCHRYSQWRFSTWMGRTCSTQVQVQRDGRVSVVHAGDLVDNSALNARIEPETVAEVLGIDSKSVFDVVWSEDAYPRVVDGCSSSCTVHGDTCLCDVEAVSSAVFTDSLYIPTASEAAGLHVGALDPTAYDEGEYFLCNSALCDAAEVDVWSKRYRMHEVLDAEIEEVNIALNKPTATSSNLGASQDAWIVDGSTTSGLYHSACSGEQWVQVDLEEVTRIDSVKLHHRTDCCGSRINGATIIISDTDDFTAGSQCGDALSWVNGATVNLCNGMSGRYVTVRQEGQCLQMTELEVLVEAISTPDGYVYSPDFYEFVSSSGTDELVYDENTIFEVPREDGTSTFYKNQDLRVTVDDQSFRNPPTMMNFEHPTLAQAQIETDSVLDHLTTHASTAPFICKKFIKLLTSSNPSPRYVLEVVTAFRTGEYNGRVFSGEYGDLGATMAAIFLDREARDLTLDLDPAAGKIREPLLKLMHLFRSLEFVPNRNMEFEMPHLDNSIGQQAFKSPSVFNFYLPDYSPAGPLARASLYAPEAEILTTPFMIGYMNGVAELVDGGLSSCGRGFGTAAPSPAPHLYMPQSCGSTQARKITSNGVLTYEHQNRAGDVVSELALLLTNGREPPAIRAYWDNSQVQYMNVALNKPTTASSVWNAAAGAFNIADGLRTDGLTTGGGLFHSQCGGEQWAQVDLQAVTEIDSVRLYHRMDCCGTRINGATVLISDTTDFTSGVQCAAPLVFTGDPVGTLSCPGVSGRYVTVRQEGQCLQIRELQVLAVRDGVTGEPTCSYEDPADAAALAACTAVTALEDDTACVAAGCQYTPGVPSEPVPSAADMLPDLIKMFAYSPEYGSTNQNILRDHPRSVMPEIPSQNRPYKAIIVVFLEGGADSFNMLIPHSGCVRDLYAEYAEIRSNIALPLAQILPMDLHAESDTQPCTTYGTHPALGMVKTLWDAGHASWFANIGTLITPITRDDFFRGDRPPRLFGHDSQQREAQSVHAQNSGASGVLGRIVDAVSSQENPYRSKVYSMYGIRKLVEGVVAPAVIGGGGVIRFSQYDTLGLTLQEMTGRESDSLFADTFAQILEDSLVNTERLGAQMADVNLLGDYTGGTGMEHIARVMALDHSVHESERDVFMVGIRTFDAHQNPPHMDINMHLTHLNNDLIALHTDLTALNLWESTTIVSISDFARTITSNGIGTDHAWGGHNFILGGSVKGGRIHGQYPEDLSPETSELEVGRGRGVFIPTTPWEGMWYGLAQWFGVDEDQMAEVLPNAANFPDTALHTQEELFV